MIVSTANSTELDGRRCNAPIIISLLRRGSHLSVPVPTAPARCSGLGTQVPCWKCPKAVTRADWRGCGMTRMRYSPPDL
jgi:hypothetical protein